MAFKKLVVLYLYDTDANKAIADSDRKYFYDKIKDNSAFKDAGILLEVVFFPDAKALGEKLELIAKEPYEEVYLHFSGHGLLEGILINEWKLENDHFARMINSRKVKFCFFSSCMSTALAQAAKENKVPIVIGTKDGQKIGNKYAIEFQLKFYTYLSEKLSYQKAFDKACDELEREHQSANANNEESNDVLTRSLEIEDQGVTIKNEFQIIMEEELKETAFLIPPTVVEAIKSKRKKEPILIAYSDNSNTLKSFEKKFHENDFQQHCNLIPLRKKELENINLSAFDDLLKIRPMKILFIIGSDKAIFDNNQPLIDIFDREVVFNEWRGLKFGVVYKDENDLKNAYSGTDNFSDLIKLKFRTKYTSIKDLFTKNDAFNTFITEIKFDASLRKASIMNFPNNEVKEVSKYHLQDVNNIEFLTRVLFIKESNERLANFIINKLRDFFDFMTPNIIYKNDSEETESLEEALISGVKHSYKDSAGYDDRLLSKGASRVFSRLYEEGHVILIHIDFGKFDNIQREVNEFLNKIKINPTNVIEPDVPTFIFLIDKSESDFISSPIERMKIKPYSPLAVTKKEFDDWANDTKYKNIKFAKLINKLIIEFNNITPEELSKKCPSDIISLACNNFKISSGDILKIS